MHVQVNSDRTVEGHELLAADVSSRVEAVLSRVGDQITRVEVHLSDEDGHKHGQKDKRCIMEARLAGLQPLAASHHAGSLDEAIDGAADKLSRLIDSTLGRLANRSGPKAEPYEQDTEPQAKE